MVKNVSIIIVSLFIAGCSKQYSGESFVTYTDNVLSLQISNKDLKKIFSIEYISEIKFLRNNEFLFSYAGYDLRTYYCVRDDHYLYLSFSDVEQLPDYIIIRYHNHTILIYLYLYDGNKLEIKDIGHHSMT